MSKPIDFATTLAAVTQTHQVFMAHVLGPYELTQLQYHVLGTLAERDYPITISQFATRIGMEQPAATKIVRKFLLRELVNVTPSSVDKRIKFVALTPQGRALEFKIQEDMRPAYEQMMNDLGNGASEWLMRDLSRLNSHINSFLEHAAA